MSTGQQRKRRQGRRQADAQQHEQGSESLMHSAMVQSQGMVTQHPTSSALIAFGVGLGVGVAVGSILCSATEPPPSFGHRAELAAEKLGRQVLDAISSVLPQSIARHVA